MKPLHAILSAVFVLNPIITIALHPANALAQSQPTYTGDGTYTLSIGDTVKTSGGILLECAEIKERDSSAIPPSPSLYQVRFNVISEKYNQPVPTPWLTVGVGTLMSDFSEKDYRRELRIEIVKFTPPADLSAGIKKTTVTVEFTSLESPPFPKTPQVLDLVIEDFSYSQELDPYNSISMLLHLNFYVKNQGAAKLEQRINLIAKNLTTGKKIFDVYSKPPPGPGARINSGRILRFDNDTIIAGKNEIEIMIDPNNELEELNESNNTYTAVIDIVDVRKPDLIINDIATTRNSSDGKDYLAVKIENRGGKIENKTIAIVATGIDTGNIYNGSIAAGLFSSNEKREIIMKEPVWTNPELAPATATPAPQPSSPVRPPAPPANSLAYDSRLRAVIDPDNLIAEAYEDNNTFEQTVFLTPTGNLGSFVKMDFGPNSAFPPSIMPTKNPTKTKPDIMAYGADILNANDKKTASSNAIKTSPDNQTINKQTKNTDSKPPAAAAVAPSVSYSGAQKPKEQSQQLEPKTSGLERELVAKEKKLATATDEKLVSRFKGKILRQVEEKGEIWYLDSVTKNRYFLKNGTTAAMAIKTFGSSITNAKLAKIPVGIEERAQITDKDKDKLDDNLEKVLGTNPDNPDSDQDGAADGKEVRAGLNPLGRGWMATDAKLASRLEGKILLPVEDQEGAWYVHGGKRFYMKDGQQAYQIMRFLSMGITNNNLRKIAVGEFE